MSTSHALIVALDLAKRQRDDARQRLQDAQALEQAAHQQMEQLKGYTGELDDKWGMRPDAVVKPEVMFHHYQFMDRLNHAMGLQSGVIHDRAAQVQKAHQALLAAEVRMASLQKLVERRQLDASQAAARQEQKQTDERASTVLRMRKNLL